MAKLCIISLLITATLIGFVQSQNQGVVLYENSGQTGAFVTLGANYVPDLASYSFNNRAKSVCVTGVWLFYANTNYNGNVNAAMEYVFGNNYCANLRLAGAVSSIRFAGASSDYRTPSLTFYTNTYFQGAEEYTYADLPNLSLRGRIVSLIVTGGRADGWTLYDRPNYSGNAVCVYPPGTDVYEPAFIHDTNIIGVPHNTIASVRRGCFGSRTAEVQPVQRGYHEMPVQIEKLE